MRQVRAATAAAWHLNGLAKDLPSNRVIECLTRNPPSHGRMGATPLQLNAIIVGELTS